MKSRMAWMLTLLTFTLALGFPGLLYADSGKKPFTLNGRPVPKVVATVNGIELHSDLIEREMMAFKMMSAQQGKTVKPESEDKIAREILNKEINQELIYQKARLMDVNVPQEIVLQEIQKIQDQFPSEQIFEKALEMQLLTRGKLREKVEKQLVAEQYLRREIIPRIHIDESSAQQYYEENKASFMKPQMYAVSHIFVQTIDPDKQGKTEDPEGRKKAKRIIEGVNREARKKIEDVRKKLKQGGEFAKLAKEHSEDEASKDKGGSLGTLVPETTIPEIAQVMTKLEIGETSGVIESAYGLHLIRLTDKIPSQIAAFDEIKADILNMLMMRETEKYKEELLVDLKKSADIKILI